MLDSFLNSSDETHVTTAACELRNESDPQIIWPLIAALHDTWEPRRFAASLALCFKRDRRTVRPMMAVVSDAAGQSIRTRCMSAEALGYLGKRKAISCVIAASRDDSADLRFWRVFALGKFLNRRRGGRLVERALLDRLGDHAEASEYGTGYWSVHLEAVAMLRSARYQSKRNRLRIWTSYELEFEREQERIRNDVYATEAEKRWLDCYQDG